MITTQEDTIEEFLDAPTEEVFAKLYTRVKLGNISLEEFTLYCNIIVARKQTEELKSFRKKLETEGIL